MLAKIKAFIASAVAGYSKFTSLPWYTHSGIGLVVGFLLKVIF